MKVMRLLPGLVVGLAIGCGAGRGGDVPLPLQARTATGGAVPVPGTAWIVFGADTVHAEVARTSDERARGLMYRDQVPAGTGMLFVFSDAQVRSFWMQNTYVSLDIAFLDADLRIVDIQQMEAESEDFHESRAPAMFALEVPKGWFAEHGITAGQRAEVIFGG